MSDNTDKKTKHSLKISFTLLYRYSNTSPLEKNVRRLYCETKGYVKFHFVTKGYEKFHPEITGYLKSKVKQINT